MEQIMNNDRRSAEIRRLNDELRCHARGGKVLITTGVSALTVVEVGAIFEAIVAFDHFTPDNDPFGEHDCATLTVDGRRLIWKIDYYDRTRQYGSPDPADPTVTFRVLTVMLSEEY
jgi:hypothetical protein